MSFAIPLLILIVAFGFLIFTFAIVGRLDERKRKWVGLTLILGTVLSWVFDFNIWLIVQSIITIIFFITYPGVLGRRIRGITLLLGIVLGYLLIVGIILGAAILILLSIDNYVLDLTLILPKGRGPLLLVLGVSVSGITVGYFLRERIVALARFAFQMIQNSQVHSPGRKPPG